MPLREEPKQEILQKGESSRQSVVDSLRRGYHRALRVVRIEEPFDLKNFEGRDIDDIDFSQLSREERRHVLNLKIKQNPGSVLFYRNKTLVLDEQETSAIIDRVLTVGLRENVKHLYYEQTKFRLTDAQHKTLLERGIELFPLDIFRSRGVLSPEQEAALFQKILALGRDDLLKAFRYRGSLLPQQLSDLLQKVFALGNEGLSAILSDQSLNELPFTDDQITQLITFDPQIVLQKMESLKLSEDHLKDLTRKLMVGSKEFLKKSFYFQNLLKKYPFIVDLLIDEFHSEIIDLFDLLNANPSQRQHWLTHFKSNVGKGVLLLQSDVSLTDEELRELVTCLKSQQGTEDTFFRSLSGLKDEKRNRCFACVEDTEVEAFLEKQRVSERLFEGWKTWTEHGPEEGEVENLFRVVFSRPKLFAYLLEHPEFLIACVKRTETSILLVLIEDEKENFLDKLDKDTKIKLVRALLTVKPATPEDKLDIHDIVGKIAIWVDSMILEQLSVEEQQEFLPTLVRLLTRNKAIDPSAPLEYAKRIIDQ